MKIEEIKNEQINEVLYKSVFDNGLKVFYLKKEGFSKKYAVFATNYGSNDNEFVPFEKDSYKKVPEGIAHFLEHKLFEEPEGNIFNKFSKLGSYVNAYTNFNQTAYLFSCSDKFNENLELLVKFVQNPYFTDENVEKEKGIIEQEIRMYEDNPNWKVFFNCLRGMYVNHPVKSDIAGTVESISKIDKETLYDCYNTFYNPSNMVLFLVGDIDFNEALNVIKASLRNDIKKMTENIKRKKEKEPNNINIEKIEENLSVAVPLFNIGVKDNDLDLEGDEFLKKQLATDILHEMLFSDSSEFYLKYYEEGLINSSFGSQYVGNIDYGHSIIGGESDKPLMVLEKIKNYIDEISKEGMSEESFNRVKRKLIGHHLIRLNSVEYIANNFISYYFKNTSLLDYLNVLENISFSDVQYRFNSHLKDFNYCISIINPK